MTEYEDADDDIGADCEIEMTMAMLFHLLRCFFLLIFPPRWVQLTAVSRIEEPVCVQPFRLQVCLMSPHCHNTRLF